MTTATLRDELSLPTKERVLINYWPGLDGLRTLAFLLVFFHHMGAVPGLQHPRDLVGVAQRVISFGWIGVDLFFVISGFLMTSLLSAEIQRFGSLSFKSFYARRALRIWPAYFTLLAVVLFVLPFISYSSWTLKGYFHFVAVFAPSLSFFVGNFSILRDVAGTWALCQHYHVTLVAPLLTPLWSLCIEEQFYLVLPLALTLVLSTRARLSLFSGALVASVITRMCIQHFYPAAGHDAWYRNTFAHLDPLMIGCLIATCNQRFELFRRAKPFGVPLLLVSLTMLFASLGLGPAITSTQMLSGLSVLLTGLSFGGLLIVGCSWTPAARALSLQPIAAIGKKTYCMYLWHCFVMSLVGQWMVSFGLAGATPENWLVRCVASFALTFLLAVVSWRLIEAPCNKLKSHFERS